MGLHDRSSRPAKTRTNLDESLRQRIEQLRRARMPMRNIARIVGRSVATVSRLLARLGLSSLNDLPPSVVPFITRKSGVARLIDLGGG